MTLRATLSTYYRLNQLRSGRRELVLRAMAAKATEFGWSELATHCLAALEQEVNARELWRTWRAHRARQGRAPTDPDLKALDNQIDQVLGGIVRDLKNKATSLASTSMGTLARAFLDEVFPAGAVEITSMAWVDEVREVKDLLGVLQGARSSEVEALGIGVYVEQLARLNAEFEVKLAAVGGQVVSYDQVRKVEAEAQERLLQAVALILGRYYDQTDDHVSRRVALLRVLTEQNDAVSAMVRAQRRVTDVDPTTGAELDSEDGPIEPMPEG